jgi:hypothetical protein
MHAPWDRFHAFVRRQSICSRAPTAAGGPRAPGTRAGRARTCSQGAAAAQELRSLAQQLCFSYAANIRAAAPAHLHLTSMAGRMGALLRRQLSGLENWAVTRAEAPYLDLFAERTEQLVYLTAGAYPGVSRHVSRRVIGVVVGVSRLLGVYPTAGARALCRRARPRPWPPSSRQEGTGIGRWEFFLKLVC